MAEITAQQAFDIALQHHQAGRFRQAEDIYQQIIAAFPDHVDSIHNLGVLALQMGRSDVATVVLRRAVALRPDFADAHSNLTRLSRSRSRAEHAHGAIAADGCRAVCARHRISIPTDVERPARWRSRRFISARE